MSDDDSLLDTSTISTTSKAPARKRDYKSFMDAPNTYRRNTRGDVPLEPTISQRISHDEGFTLGPRVGIARDCDGLAVSWDVIRKHYVVGDRVQTTNGSWVNEKITLHDLAVYYNVGLHVIKARSKKENWSKLRDAYVAKVQERNMGIELTFYTQENFDNETTAMASARKLGKVLETYIDTKYGEILQASDSLEESDISNNDELMAEFNRVNNNTGVNVFINELQSAVKVAESIYSLQRKIYTNSQEEEGINIADVLKKPKFKNDRERETKLNQLRQRLLMSQGTEDVEEVLIGTDIQPVLLEADVVSDSE